MAQVETVLGKAIIIRVSGEKHQGHFALTDLDSIIPSHNPFTFASSEGYPTDKQGNNINDRDYKADKYAQAQVAQYAQNLDPELLITTSRTSSGTPIVTEDMFVVSGNNRTMSMKLAAEKYPERWAAYQDFLQEELAAFGLNEEDLSRFKKPVLVRIDYDFGDYTTANMAKYNEDTQKGKRQIDSAVALSKTLESNPNCVSTVANMFGEFENMSEFYSSQSAQTGAKSYLIGCGVLKPNKVQEFWNDNTSSFNQAGKNLLETTIVGLILEKKTLEALEAASMKGLRRAIVLAINPLLKNKGFKEASIIQDLNEAIILAAKIRAFDDSQSTKSFGEFLGQKNLFGGEKWSIKALAINRLLSEKGPYALKKALIEYNTQAQNKESGLVSMFKEQLPEIDYFEAYFFDPLTAKAKQYINAYVGRKEEEIDDNNDTLALLFEAQKKRVASLLSVFS